MKKLLVIASLSALFLAGCGNNPKPADDNQLQDQNQGQSLNTGSAQNISGETCDDGTTCKVDLTGALNTGSSQNVSGSSGAGEDKQTKEIEKDLNDLLDK